jgi:hypothetical protein
MGIRQRGLTAGVGRAIKVKQGTTCGEGFFAVDSCGVGDWEGLEN